MGWERKRGKLEEVNRLLRGDDKTSFVARVGDASILPKVRFVITLDADTQLPRDAAKRLIGTLAHPMNRPILNERGTRVVEGYGVLQPRVAVTVTSASHSFFAMAFAGHTGVDPYPTAVSDMYQDIFGASIYMGKGIYDVEAFRAVLDGRIPENTVLSHDLLEGSYARAGLVSDVELVDSFPAHYSAFAGRMHRWVRGDWQLLRWLWPWLRDPSGQKARNPVTMLAK